MTTGLDLLADGTMIRLTDGTTASLRYSFRALALLEARFGSVTAVQSVLDNTNGEKPAFGPLAQIIGSALVGPGGFEPHIREHQDAKGERKISGDIVFRRKTTGADLADLLHPGLLNEYVAAFTSAFGRALASPGNDEAGPTVTVETVKLPTDFLGRTATTSPSEPSTSALVSSGT